MMNDELNYWMMNWMMS